MLELLNIIAMALAIRGSSNFVREDFETGAWQFMLGNVINMAVGLAIGNLWLFLAQAGLMYFTLNMPKLGRPQAFRMLALLAIILVSVLGISDTYAFSYINSIDVVATIGAIYGAYAMSKQNWSLMAKMWIIADMGFMWVAYEAGLLGLFIQSIIFVYHGYLRLTGKPIPAIW